MARRAEELSATADLTERYRKVRRVTEALAAPLSEEDCQVQSMPDVSPTKWHLAHVTWFFETFVVASSTEGYRWYDDDYQYLFNSYYNSVGKQYPRPNRGLITRPTLAEVLDYRRHVDEQVVSLIDSGRLDETAAAVLVTGLNHEQQHQELLLMDIKHVLSCNPLHPAYRPKAVRPDDCAAPVLEWLPFPEGLREIGHAGEGFAFDNEKPRHRRFVHGFELASRLVTNGEYLDFMVDGGYEDPLLWLSDGWDAVQANGWRTPLYWVERDGEWFEFTLRGLEPLDRDVPVCHLSYYEADAFAEWAGARLPTEAEWETATAMEEPMDGNFLESGLLHPRTAAHQGSLRQFLGDCWEWTSSAYAPYPGYRPPRGALGEYNGKFMCNQMVMRGGGCVTPESHIRPTYRNFFYPRMRWQFGGIRLARDLKR